VCVCACVSACVCVCVRVRVLCTTYGSGRGPHWFPYAYACLLHTLVTRLFSSFTGWGVCPSATSRMCVINSQQGSTTPHTPSPTPPHTRHTHVTHAPSYPSLADPPLPPSLFTTHTATTEARLPAQAQVGVVALHVPPRRPSGRRALQSLTLYTITPVYTSCWWLLDSRL
jgi:hypothetical protein